MSASRQIFPHRSAQTCHSSPRPSPGGRGHRTPSAGRKTTPKLSRFGKRRPLGGSRSFQGPTGGETMFIGKIQAAALAATTSICMAFGAGAAEAQTILRMNNWLPAGHLQLVNILLPWAEEVEKVTEGR